jgi:hypothetical protein
MLVIPSVLYCLELFSLVDIEALVGLNTWPAALVEHHWEAIRAQGHVHFSLFQHIVQFFLGEGYKEVLILLIRDLLILRPNPFLKLQNPRFL